MTKDGKDRLRNGAAGRGGGCQGHEARGWSEKWAKGWVGTLGYPAPSSDPALGAKAQRGPGGGEDRVRGCSLLSTWRALWLGLLQRSLQTWVPRHSRCQGSEARGWSEKWAEGVEGGGRRAEGRAQLVKGRGVSFIS